MEGNQRLRAARKRMHWSQTEAAKACEVNLQTFFRWERGEQEPHGYNLDQLCRVFHASAEELGYAHLVNVPSEAEATAVPDDQNGSFVRLTGEQVAVLLPLVEEKTVDQAKRDTLRAILETTGIAVAAPHALANPEPWERLSTVHRKPAALNDATFALFGRLLENCWELSNQNELEVAYGILSSFLPKILTLPPGDVDSRIAYLASQGLRLQSVLVHHNSKLSEKVLLCQRSVEYARSADDVNTLVAALMELAVAYKYNGQSDHWFKAFQEVLYYSPQASPLLQSQAYFKSALAFAYYKRKREAELYLQMAFDVFPDHPEHDPGYMLADASIFTLSRDAGRVYLELGQIPEAYSAFERYQQDASGMLIPERVRLEIINGETRAAALEHHREKYASFLQEGLTGAVSLGSKRRFDEAYTLFREEMPASWLKDSDIQSIAEQYHLTRERNEGL